MAGFLSRRYCTWAAAPLVTVLLVVLPPASRATAQTPSVADLALSAAPDRLERLVAGAKREKTLTLYSSAPPNDMEQIIVAFEKKYGLKVNLWRGSAEEILQRVLTEARAGRADVDVAETSPVQMEAMVREGLLQRDETPVIDDLIPQSVMAHHQWFPTRLTLFTGIYNKDLVEPQDVPKSYEDLLDPKWKGKLGIESEASNWLMTIVDTMGEEKGLQLFRDIVDRNGIVVRKGHTVLANATAAGEIPLALNVYNFLAGELKAAGAPVEALYLPPIVALPAGAGMMQKAPRPNAALLFLDFILTEGQKILVAEGALSTNRTVQEPPEGLDLAFVDNDKVLDEGEKWTRLYHDIFVGKAR